MKNLTKRLLCGFLTGVLLVLCLVGSVFAAENAFVLVAEAGGKLILGPEYVSYTSGQSIAQALAASGHTFTGLDMGMVSAIDGVTGNFTRSDENGGYDLSASAASIGYFRFSEDTDSKPSRGLQQLMRAMADYRQKDADVQQAAKEAYETARSQFVGLDSAAAETLAADLNAAISSYESSLKGEKFPIRFTDGGLDFSRENYSGISVTARNAYGKLWTDDGDGILELPEGSYTFCIEQDGLRVTGSLNAAEDTAVTARLPDETWLKTDTFRISGSYGDSTNTEHRFLDEEWTPGDWLERQVTVPVPDTFTGAV